MSSKLLINESPLQVLPSLAVAVGLNLALVLQQTHYWLQLNGKTRDGRRWIFMTHDDWKRQFPFFSVSTIRRAIEEGEALGLLLTTDSYNKSRADRTKWYSIDYAALDALEMGTAQNEQATAQNEQPSVQIEQSSAQNEQLYIRNKISDETSNKRESERLDLEADAVPPALPSLAQKIETAEQSKPALTVTGMFQGKANAQHDAGQEPKNVPGAASRLVDKPVDNSAERFRSTTELLNRVFGARVIADMIGNPASLADRKRWYAVPLDRALELLGQAKTEAHRSGYTPQTVLKKLLDDEVLRDGLPPMSAPISESVPAAGKQARFEAGQRVVFRGLPYSVLAVGERKLTLRTDDEDADELDVLFSSNDFAAVRAVGG